MNESEAAQRVPRLLVEIREGGYLSTTREKGRKPRANSEAWSRQGFDFEIACAGVVG